jgi:hypothetical protein
MRTLASISRTASGVSFAGNRFLRAAFASLPNPAASRCCFIAATILGCGLPSRLASESLSASRRFGRGGGATARAVSECAASRSGRAPPAAHTATQCAAGDHATSFTRTPGGTLAAGSMTPMPPTSTSKSRAEPSGPPATIQRPSGESAKRASGRPAEAAPLAAEPAKAPSALLSAPAGAGGADGAHGPARAPVAFEGVRRGEEAHVHGGDAVGDGAREEPPVGGPGAQARDRLAQQVLALAQGFDGGPLVRASVSRRDVHPVLAHDAVREPHPQTQARAVERHGGRRDAGRGRDGGDDSGVPHAAGAGGVVGGPQPDASVARAGGEHARRRGVPRRGVAPARVLRDDVERVRGSLRDGVLAHRRHAPGARRAVGAGGEHARRRRGKVHRAERVGCGVRPPCFSPLGGPLHVVDGGGVPLGTRR